MTATEDKMFQEALKAIEEGKNSRAKDLLTRLLRQNQKNADYWLWMSAVVDSQKEQRYCLNQVLQIDPQNQFARRGLTLLGDLPPDPKFVIPIENQKYNWTVGLPDDLEETKIKLPWPKIALGFVGAVVAVGLIIAALSSNRLWIYRNRNVAVLGTAQATPTYPPTATQTVTLTPKYVGPTPPWGGLSATYTPTPIYVNTPHPLIEAYVIGQRYYSRGEWEKAIEFFNQAIKTDPSAPDLYYLLGESYRLNGENENALKAYDEALSIDQSFAPAYLGKAYLQLDDPEEAIANLQSALDYDNNLAEAYILLANLYIDQQNIDDAQQLLVDASAILPESPNISLANARIALQKDQFDVAVQYAEKALQEDITNLDAYRLLGQALQADGRVKESLDPLNIYITYFEGKDPQALAWLANAYAANDMDDKALALFEEAISADSRQVEIYLTRGRIYLKNKEYDLALDDFERALRINPNSYEICMLTGQSLLLTDSPGNAYNQISECQKLAEDDRQLAQMFFYRALALEALQNKVAVQDWERMLNLPEDAIETEWRQTAQAYLGLHYTPTPTFTATATLLSTVTPEIISTPSPTSESSEQY